MEASSNSSAIFYVAIILGYAIIFSYIFIGSLKQKLSYFKIESESSLKYLEESTKRDLKRLQEENFDLRDQLRKLNCKS